MKPGLVNRLVFWHVILTMMCACQSHLPHLKKRVIKSQFIVFWCVFINPVYEKAYLVLTCLFYFHCWLKFFVLFFFPVNADKIILLIVNVCKEMNVYTFNILYIRTLR